MKIVTAEHAEAGFTAGAAGEDCKAALDISGSSRRRRSGGRVGVFVAIPLLTFLLAAGAGYFHWRQAVLHQDVIAQTPAVKAAADGAVALLSYRPDTAEKDIATATSRLTGPFRETFTTFTRDVVIPNATEKKIAATAMVPGAAPMSIDGKHAVVIVFVNQAITVGDDAPSSTVSSVKVTLDEIGGHWLISGFEPI